MKKIKSPGYKQIIDEEVYNLRDDLFKNILRGIQWKTDDGVLKKLFWVIWDGGWIWQVLKIMQLLSVHIWGVCYHIGTWSLESDRPNFNYSS